MRLQPRRTTKRPPPELPAPNQLPDRSRGRCPETRSCGGIGVPGGGDRSRRPQADPRATPDRLRLLEEHDRLRLALQRRPTPNRARNTGTEAKAELDRLQTILTQAAKAPETLLPPSFLGSSARVSTALSSEMKDAIEATTNELKEWKTKIETLRSPDREVGQSAKARRAERDRALPTAHDPEGQERGVRGGGDGRPDGRSAAARPGATGQLRVGSAGGIAPASGHRGRDRPGGQAGRRPRAEPAGLPRAHPDRRENARADAGAVPRGRRGTRARLESGRGQRREQGPVVGRPAGTIPRSPHRRAARAGGTGPQERAGAGHQSFSLLRGAAQTWPTTPKAISRRSRSCSTTAGSAGWTRSA